MTARAQKPVIQRAPLLKLPASIISNILCTFIEAEDLVEFSATCSSLFETCDKSIAWENICRHEGIDGEKEKITNWRRHYLLHRSKYFYRMNARDPKLINHFKRERQIKVVLLGAGGIGKSNTVIQYVAKKFFTEYDPTTTEEYYSKQVTLVNKTVKLEILDTAGLDEGACSIHLLQKSNVFVIFFDITNRPSFNEVSEYHQRIITAKQSRATENQKQIDPALKKFCDRPPCAILVGNKLDLKEERKITTQEGKEMAKSLQSKYMEISAKKDINVDALFEEVVWMFARDVYYAEENQQDTKSGPIKKKCIVM